MIPLLLLSTIFAAGAQRDWKPAEGPLMTRWAPEVGPENALPEYPRPQMVRPEWVNLNGLWQFASAQAGGQAPIGEELEERILVPFPIESALSGVMRRAERAWYRRLFEVPQGWRGRRLLLHFGAVDWEATVWVNGRAMGAHRGGYDSFSFDITGALTPDGPQEIVVGVFDPTDAGDQPRGKQVREPRGIWYTPTTGIWQTVWLEPVPKAHLESLVLTPDVDAGALRLIALANEAAAGHTVRALALRAGQPVGEARGRAGEETLLPVPDARRWCPDDPFLYDLRVELMEGGQAVDAVASYFGMRKIEIAKARDGITRMLLNGEPIFQIGFLDQGFWPDGLYTAPTDEALAYDIEIAKQIGMNLARKHVKIEPERWYSWCDKLGLLVWQDMPNGDNGTPEARRQFELELRRLVEGRRNHPSIIMWVPFNEGWGQHDTERYVAMIREMDPSRLVNNASGWTDAGVGDVHDVHSYPGPHSPAPEPERAAVLGEFGGLGLGVQGHTWSEEAWGYRGMGGSEELTLRYVALLRRVWGLRDDPGLCAAVYTQTTDVETECNGLLTYDRRVLKVFADRVARANRGEMAALRALAPTSQREAHEWRYTFEAPPEGWQQPGFDDSGWRRGPAGFGTRGTPGAVVRTGWSTSDIWIRRAVTLPDRLPADPLLIVHHDEDVEIYLNGVLAASARGYTTAYEEMPLDAGARALLQPGEQLVIAAHCRQTTGGQYIDVGLAELVE